MGIVKNTNDFNTPDIKIFLARDKEEETHQVRKAEAVWALEQTTVDGLNLEFGVYEGMSINWCAKHFPDKTFYGFDSFIGLPEEWATGEKVVSKDRFSLKGKLPKVRENVHLIKGYYNESLPTWWSENKAPISFLNMDSDLYSSTIYVLDYLNDYILPGTIIRFDELVDWRLEFPREQKGQLISMYPLWPEHEWKAFHEWMNRNNRKCEALSRTWFQSASVRVVQ